MDVISLGKASKALKDIKALDEQVVAPLAESRFPSVDARLDWLEKQTTNVQVTNAKEIDLTKGTLEELEYDGSTIRLKQIGSIAGAGYTENVLGKMTSDTTPAPFAVSCKSGVSVFQLFDGDVATMTNFNGPAWPFWIQVDMGSGNSQMIGKYRIIAGTNSAAYSQAPKTWTIQASNTGVFEGEEIILDSRADVTWINGEIKEFTFENDKKYRYYRLVITANNGNSSMRFNEIELMAIDSIPKYGITGTYESPVVDLGASYNQSIGAVIDRLIYASTVPLETGTTGGKSFSNYIFNLSYGPDDAFNGILTGDGDAWLGSTTPPYELGYEFKVEQSVGAYTIYPRSVGADHPVDWTFEAWDEANQSWVVLDTQTGITDWQNSVPKTFTINGLIYTSKKFRLNMTKSVSNARVAINELQFYPAQSIASVEVATSSNGKTFSAYEKIDDGQVPQGRYIKVRAVLQGVPESNNTNEYEFNGTDSNKVEANSFVLENGDLQLQKEYTYAFEDVSVLSGGKIAKAVIPKSIFKQMNSLGVK